MPYIGGNCIARYSDTATGARNWVSSVCCFQIHPSKDRLLWLDFGWRGFLKISGIRFVIVRGILMCAKRVHPLSGYVCFTLGLIAWLVVWLPFLAFSHDYWECHHPNWRTPIFQRGGPGPPTSWWIWWWITSSKNHGFSYEFLWILGKRANFCYPPGSSISPFYGWAFHVLAGLKQAKTQQHQHTVHSSWMYIPLSYCFIDHLEFLSEVAEFWTSCTVQCGIQL